MTEYPELEIPFLGRSYEEMMETLDRNILYPVWLCPNCGRSAVDFKDIKNCPYCGVVR